MGPVAAAAFDDEVRQALDELTYSGVIRQHEGRLQLSVEARVTWGKPRAARTLAD